MIKSNEALCILTTMTVAMLLMPGTLAASNDVLFQASAISALMDGVYNGTMSFKDLSAHGDFGLGTVDSLDGEMIGLDGQFYQVKSDGKAYRINDSMETPFAEVTFFKPKRTIALDGMLNLTQMENNLDGRLGTKNLIYAFRIDSTFDYVKTRSPQIQSEPYPTLPEALEEQKIFEFHNISGTIVGFRFPNFVDGINVPGYHVHFITSDRSAGGHILDLKLSNASVKVDDLSELEMALPNNEEFYQADLSGNNETDLNKVESNPKS
jgi:acetolactate decarboxylase